MFDLYMGEHGPEGSGSVAIDCHKIVNQTNERKFNTHCISHWCFAAIGIPTKQTFGRQPHTAKMLLSLVNSYLCEARLIDFSATEFIQSVVLCTEMSSKRLTVVAAANDSIAVFRCYVESLAFNRTTGALQFNIHSNSTPYLSMLRGIEH